MVLFLMFKISSFYYEKTQGKLTLHREITGKTVQNTVNFAFRDEWEPCCVSMIAVFTECCIEEKMPMFTMASIH